MPLSALPPDFHNQAKGTGTDWDNGIQKNWKHSWFAYSPRATERWAKWREWPITILGLFGKGKMRWENDVFSLTAPISTLFCYSSRFSRFYPSRIQYYARWSFQISWPLSISFHWYWKETDVPATNTRPDSFGINRLVFCYLITHRDADKVYWFPSLYIGGQWK